MRPCVPSQAEFSAALLASFDAKVQALDFGLATAPDSMNSLMSRLLTAGCGRRSYRPAAVSPAGAP